MDGFIPNLGVNKTWPDLLSDQKNHKQVSYHDAKAVLYSHSFDNDFGVTRDINNCGKERLNVILEEELLPDMGSFVYLCDQYNNWMDNIIVPYYTIFKQLNILGQKSLYDLIKHALIETLFDNTHATDNVLYSFQSGMDVNDDCFSDSKQPTLLKYLYYLSELRYQAEKINKGTNYGNVLLSAFSKQEMLFCMKHITNQLMTTKVPVTFDEKKSINKVIRIYQSFFLNYIKIGKETEKIQTYDKFMLQRITNPEYELLPVEMEFLKKINPVVPTGMKERVGKVISMIKSKHLVDGLRSTTIKFESDKFKQFETTVLPKFNFVVFDNHWNDIEFYYHNPNLTTELEFYLKLIRVYSHLKLKKGAFEIDWTRGYATLKWSRQIVKVTMLQYLLLMHLKEGDIKLTEVMDCLGLSHYLTELTVNSLYRANLILVDETTITLNQDLYLNEDMDATVYITDILTGDNKNEVHEVTKNVKNPPSKEFAN